MDAHLDATTPWYSYHETLREPTARLVGAKPLEVICMNSLTVNLHLMMATFYRPTKSRFKILMEEPAFPSDTYAIKSQIVHHGLDPKEALILAQPRKGEFTVRTEEIIDLIEQNAGQLAVVMIGAVNFFTGQLFDIEKITKVAQKRDITVDFDLAHAIGNVPLGLHDWNVDFGVWCSYKYLNAGPGAVAGPMRNCPAWPVGLGTIPTPASVCISTRNSFRFNQQMAGKSATRQSFRWRRCAHHCRSSMKPAEWNRCAQNRSS